MQLKNRRLFIVGLTILVLLLSFFVLFFSKNSKENNNLIIAPTPVQVLPQNISLPNDSIVDEASKKMFERQYVIDKVINALPYSGKNFSLSYNYSSNEFVLQLNSTNSDQANAEFNLFLKQNGVERAWIQNVVVTYK